MQLRCRHVVRAQPCETSPSNTPPQFLLAFQSSCFVFLMIFFLPLLTIYFRAPLLLSFPAFFPSYLPLPFPLPLVSSHFVPFNCSILFYYIFSQHIVVHLSLYHSFHPLFSSFPSFLATPYFTFYIVLFYFILFYFISFRSSLRLYFWLTR